MSATKLFYYFSVDRITKEMGKCIGPYAGDLQLTIINNHKCMKKHHNNHDFMLENNLTCHIKNKTQKTTGTSFCGPKSMNSLRGYIDKGKFNVNLSC